MGKFPKKKIVSVNFSYALFCLLFTPDDLAMQVIVWLCMVHFRAIQFDAVWFGTSYANWRRLHTFKHQI